MSLEELRKKYSAPTDEVSSEESTEKTENSTEDEEEDIDLETEEDDSQESEVGLKSLLDEGEITKTDKNNDLINDAAAIAESIQPKGNTLSSTSVSGL